MINKSIIYKFFKDFTNTERRLTAILFSCRLFPTFLNTGTTDETFQQSGKSDYFTHTLKGSASVYESSGLQFFRTTYGIQSGLNTFDGSRFAMTFLTILKVTEI